MAFISLRNINKIYPNGFHAVHNFNLDIEQGEFVVFVGPSGCGKSTTLRMIAGLEDISDGEFLLEGARANEKGPRERGIAMVFQSYALYPQMTVFDNIAFGLTLQGVDEDEIDRRVRNTARILGLTDYLDRLPRALSGGQRQRVAIGRAIIRKVNIFLMDEPLSNLDAKQRVTMRYEIAQIHRETGATTIYVTHDQTEAMTLADRIVVMKDGYIQQVGTPFELYYKPVNVFVAGFIGEPPMNFVRGTLENGCMTFGENRLDLSGWRSDVSQWEGKKLVLGFRPEAISLKEIPGALRVESMVELTELLGDNSNIYVKSGESTAILKVDSHDTPEMDEPLTFWIPMESVYLFDSETEQALGGDFEVSLDHIVQEDKAVKTAAPEDEDLAAEAGSPEEDAEPVDADVAEASVLMPSESAYERARREGRTPVALHGIKKPEVQANLAIAIVGQTCEVIRRKRENKDDLWLVSSDTGILGCLVGDEYHEGQTVVLAAVKDRPDREIRYKPFVYVL